MATPSLSLARRAAVRLQGVASACRLQPAATARTTRASALPDALRASRPHVVLSLADLRHLKHLRAPLGALRALPRAQPLAALRALRSASCARALWGGRGVGAQPPGGRTVLAAGGRGKREERSQPRPLRRSGGRLRSGLGAAVPEAVASQAAGPPVARLLRERR